MVKHMTAAALDARIVQAETPHEWLEGSRERGSRRRQAAKAVKRGRHRAR